MIDFATAVPQALAEARAADNGRSAQRVVHDGVLRQSVIALTVGNELSEHNSPPAASIHVLAGRIRITLRDADGAEIHSEEMGVGELSALTHERHAVTALEDAAFVLTTVTGIGEPSHG